ncbi:MULTISPECIES: hypothetical protein [unclassified Micromonospora]|uniref:hypothetical protein n=1 Tax=unclassified Micromonospora TaxID=2617518 RepID=UPI003A84AA60
MPADRSYVFLDVDGVLIPFAARATHHPGKALLHRVDPHLGLTDADFSTVGQWLAVDGGKAASM